MNAPVQISEVADGAVEAFLECCDQHAWFYHQGWISLHTAVDNLQFLAERWGLVADYGQDQVQQWIAYEHVLEPREEDEEPADFDRLEIAKRIQVWELADPRDAWRHTGEPPPAESVRNSDLSGKSAPWNPTYVPPKATINAFWHLAQNESPERLADWLAQHPLDVLHLQKIWEAKCSTAPAV